LIAEVVLVPDPAMRLAGVGYRYGLRDPWVLRGVDLEIQPGAITRIVGANGSGKSTLLRIMAGVHRPARGRITGNGQVGYVPGKFPELPFTALGYLLRLGRIHGLAEEEATELVDRWLDQLDAAAFRDQPIADLSRGTAQKIGVIQALMTEPRLLVLDEAWTGLDSAAQSRLDAAVLDSARRGTKVVFVDHDPDRLAAHTHAAYGFADGELVVASALPAPLTGRVSIELDGAPDPWPGPGSGRRLPDGALRVQVESGLSDDLLREILREHPKVHVRSITEVR
jgi:ABC-type Mn2+/Zn2+ transport system ATPase subunit